MVLILTVNPVLRKSSSAKIYRMQSNDSNLVHALSACDLVSSLKGARDHCTLISSNLKDFVSSLENVRPIQLPLIAELKYHPIVVRSCPVQMHSTISLTQTLSPRQVLPQLLHDPLTPSYCPLSLTSLSSLCVNSVCFPSASFLILNLLCKLHIVNYCFWSCVLSIFNVSCLSLADQTSWPRPNWQVLPQVLICLVHDPFTPSLSFHNYCIINLFWFIWSLCVLGSGPGLVDWPTWFVVSHPCMWQVISPCLYLYMHAVSLISRCCGSQQTLESLHPECSVLIKAFQEYNDKVQGQL